MPNIPTCSAVHVVTSYGYWKSSDIQFRSTPRTAVSHGAWNGNRLFKQSMAIYASLNLFHNFLMGNAISPAPNNSMNPIADSIISTKLAR